MREQILSLLGRGLQAAQVAEAVGCDPSYISQLLAEAEFAEAVQTRRAAAQLAHVEHDDSIDAMEELALAKVKQLLPFSTKISEAVKVFGILNAARRRATDVNQAATVPAQTVVINMPAAASVSVVMSSDRQVVEVEGRSMTTMPARSLAAEMEKRNAQRLLAIAVPATLLPADSMSKVAAAL